MQKKYNDDAWTTATGNECKKKKKLMQDAEAKKSLDVIWITQGHLQVISDYT